MKYDSRICFIFIFFLNSQTTAVNKSNSFYYMNMLENVQFAHNKWALPQWNLLVRCVRPLYIFEESPGKFENAFCITSVPQKKKQLRKKKNNRLVAKCNKLRFIVGVL